MFAPEIVGKKILQKIGLKIANNLRCHLVSSPTQEGWEPCLVPSPQDAIHHRVIYVATSRRAKKLEQWGIRRRICKNLEIYSQGTEMDDVGPRFFPM